MNRKPKLLRLSSAQRRLLFEACCLVIALRLALPLLRYPRVERWLGRMAAQPSAGPAAPDPELPDRVVWALDVANRRLPLKATCLARALAARSMLARRDVPSVLRIGVAPSPEAGGSIRAHAWLECDGRVLIGKAADLADYKPFPRVSATTSHAPDDPATAAPASRRGPDQRLGHS